MTKGIRPRGSFRSLLVLTFLASAAMSADGQSPETQSTQSEPPNQKVEWLGVEVVTDRPALAQEIRGKIPLPANAILDFPGDPRYEQWCDTVRSSYTEAETSCAPILMEGAKAYYVVQVEFAAKRPAKPTCDEKAPKLPTPLRAMSDRFMQLLQASLMKAPSAAAAHQEYVNDEGFLDYADAGLHEFANSAHHEIRSHLRDVVASTKVCDAADRSAAVQLMNWSGDPSANIRIGAAGILDPDEGVRNSSTRLVGVFLGKAKDSSSVEPLVRTLCTQLGYTSFSDRNKAVNVLLALADQRPSARRSIAACCGPLIRQRASNGESISPQIQGSAANLLTLLNEDGRGHSSRTEQF
jgi:hypothetical protein